MLRVLFVNVNHLQSFTYSPCTYLIITMLVLVFGPTSSRGPCKWLFCEVQACLCLIHVNHLQFFTYSPCTYLIITMLVQVFGPTSRKGPNGYFVKFWHACIAFISFMQFVMAAVKLEIDRQQCAQGVHVFKKQGSHFVNFYKTRKSLKQVTATCKKLKRS